MRRTQTIAWVLSSLVLLLLWGGEPHRVLATPLVAHGNHAGENHAGEDHAGETLDFINLTGANLSSTNFSGAYLKDANWTNANLAGTNFTNAYLEDGIFTDAILTPETTFAGASLIGAVLSHRDLRALNLNQAASLYQTDFRHSNLSGMDLSGFAGLKLDDAILINADLRFTLHPEGQNANFTGADLRHARTHEGSFSHANFTNANLQFFVGRGSTAYQHANFTNADLRFTALHGDFAGAVFTGANIYGATISGFHLDLTGAISDPHPHATPEPSTWVLLGTGLVGLLGYGWQQRQGGGGRPRAL